MSNSGKSSEFAKKVSQLQEAIDGHTSQLATKEKCLPMVLMIAAAVPLVVFLVLYFLQPGFVKKKDGGKSVRSGTKVFLWTLFVTVVAWVALYLYTWCKGYSGTMLCSRK